MKICSKCQQTYTDENLNFCLNDGTVLTQTGGGDALPETVFVTVPPPTTEPTRSFNPPTQSYGTQPQNAWNNLPQQPSNAQVRPAKSSKTWFWVLGILGFLFLLCGGGGLLGFLFYQNSSETPSNAIYASPTPSVPPITAGKINKYDMTLWKTGAGEFATTSYGNNKFTVEVTKPDYYYVIITQPVPTTDVEFETQNLITRLTVTNRQAKPVKYGFGLVVHSDTTPLTQDYAFVIDSENKKYRILHHSSKIEKELTKWTSSSAIKSGTEENVLEVRDGGRIMMFYINGQFIKSVNDEDGNTDGIAGIYASGSIPIDFSNLQTEKK